ncbi:putative WD repeat-containing protein C25H1.08c [Daldinia childiae]|uniref:putative WD repeat-containing protein C25H1.08c n=1 Tax=Daldinia childiae TaxID=326645 RepID=UPI001444D57A|nr:putative WD repeat-containing protein C25H1.08c [Daldinia childiae]KAF3068980.1 putative WD repeat-containing protein C25H1.08c [Daldinia childiae]
MSAPHRDDVDDTPEMLDAEDALEEIQDTEGDIAMDSDDEPEEITLQNDSIAYFDAHKDSVFAIAQHPTQPSLIATGGSEGEGDDAPGKGYVFDTSPVVGRPVLPPSYNADPSSQQQKSTELKPVFTIEGHSDSINTLAFTLPNGQFLVSGGLDGRLRTYELSVDAHNKPSFAFLAESQEVPEVNWLAPCPSSKYPNTIALGASDGSVWVYTIDPSDSANPMQIVQSYFLHTASCTAGSWSPDGTFLATVSEDSSLCVWDVWGEAAAKNLVNDNGQTVVSLTGQDQRFGVEGGLYAVAVDPKSTFVAVGGAGGSIKIVGLPRVGVDSQPASSKQSKTKAKGGEVGSAQGGTILADLQTQSDGIETLSFSSKQPLLAAGSVDGSIAVYDTSRRFALRRHIKEAHEEFSVVKVEFVAGLGDGWLLTSCGMDGVVRRWDVRGAASSAVTSLVKEWRGHRGDGEGGGVLGFVQGTTGERVVTAGDDGVVLVFEA